MGQTVPRPSKFIRLATRVNNKKFLNANKRINAYPQAIQEHIGHLSLQRETSRSMLGLLAQPKMEVFNVLSLTNS